MANQVIVTNTGNVQVALTPPPNVQVQISRAAIGTVSNVPTANYANFANVANIANVANSVAVANVSGIGNIATINLDGSSSNVLYGNGVFAPGGGGNAANANFANFAGTAFNVSGSNVTGTVANANYAAYAGNATIANSANAVAGANVTGVVANATFATNAGTSNSATIANSANSVTLANVSGAGNIASINLDGNASNILFGNGTFSAIPVVSNVANANYANFSGTAFSVSGSNVSGEVANAAYANAANTANLATYATTANSVAGANVSGTVANATFALDAGNSNLANVANSVAVANVSGIGNIATLNLDGNASNILFGNGTFSAIPVVSNVANANYANFAGTAFSVSGSNVSGEVANANFASYANIAASANSVALANVVGIGNIANINLDGSSSNVLFGNGVFAPESTSIANANYANFAGNALVLANGTSNISIPSANGNIVFGVAGNSDVLKITTAGFINSIPTSTALNSYVINSYDTGADAKRIASFKYRGNIATPLSVNPNDTTMRLITIGHNGAALQTSSSASIRGLVDASYTANGANIPLGWSIQVNDTNGGVNNQSKTHNFYSNGTVNFANSISVSGNGNISGTNLLVNTGTVTTQLNVGNSGATPSQVFITGDKTINSAFRITGSPFTSVMDNVNPSAGYSPFFFNTYENANTNIPPSRYFRAKGTEASPAAVTANDVVQLSSYAVYADSGNTYKDVIQTSVVVTLNDGVGNVAGDFIIAGFNANSRLSIKPDTIANNISINSNNFMKLSSYTAANLILVTGQVGWVAAVTNSAGGGNPNGMIAFWDTTNNRWSYIHDNSAV